MSHKFATVCSGIEAVSMAYGDTGEPVWFSEIAAFPSAYLAHHYPDVPNLGDMTKIQEDDRFKQSIGTVDVLWGGTPCQSFSIAGFRGGLDDERGNLALQYVRLVERLRPRWFVWENVPGVLSSNGGRDFGTFLAALGHIGYGWSYRVLDAQYFGVAQRRRRVFVVGHISGDWRHSAAVLFERESLRRDRSPVGSKRKKSPRRTRRSPPGYDHLRTEASDGDLDSIFYNQGHAKYKPVDEAGTLRKSRGDAGGGSENLVVSDISPTINKVSGTKWGSNQWVDNGEYVLTKSSNAEGSDCLPYLTASNGSKGINNQTPLLYSIMPQNGGKDYKAKTSEVAQPLMAQKPTTGSQSSDFVMERKRVRRLMPLEYERLQGFPDNHTKIPYRGKPLEKCPDNPRYEAVGNSMAVPVIKWIKERIEFVDSIIDNHEKENSPKKEETTPKG